MDQQAILTRENRISGKAAFVIPFLRKLMMLYLLVWSVSPPLGIGIVFRVLALLCAGGWFILTALTDYEFGTMQKLSLIFLLLVILVTLIESQFSISALMKQISLFMLVLAFLMSSYYENKWDDLRFLIPIFLALLIVYNFLTFNELLTNHDLARKIVRADASMHAYMRRGIGGYALVYSQVILFPLFIARIIEARKTATFHFLLGIVHIISLLALLHKAGYTIAIVASLSGTVILLFYKRKNIVPALIIALVVVFLFVWIIGYITPVREFLLDLFNGTTVADKINDIYDTIHETGTADSISLRRVKYMASVDRILNYPFIGTLWNGNSGGHSAILDSFAKYGFFGGFMFFYMICFASKRLKDENDPSLYPVANSMLVSLLIVSLLDSIPYEMIFPIMVVAPLLLDGIKKSRAHTLIQQRNRS